ncbi:MAG: ABC transporter permease [Armatimonadetes bacterium]|nr:ABC transporter permease [Armatimonadota bacterium]
MTTSSTGGARRKVVGLLTRREAVTVLLLVAAVLFSARLSPHFLDLAFLLDSTSLYMEVGLMALAMTFVIISGNIDLSVASGLALVGVGAAVLHSRAGLPMGWVIVLSLALGALLGLFNGLLITRMRLPSLTVTLGTLALYRGIAQILLGDHSLGKFPEWFVGIDYRRIGGLVPVPLLLFSMLAILLSLVLHRTVFGRWTYAIGTNEAAARFSGIPVDRIKVLIYLLSGLMMAAGGLMMTSRLTVARFDMATGRELEVITAVVLGGTDIFGGRGSVFGTVAALFLVGVLRTGMGVANIKAESQLAVLGALLLISVILSNLSGRTQR